MRGIKTALNYVWKALLWIASVGVLLIATLFFGKRKTTTESFKTENAKKKKEELYEKIKNKSSADLVNGADNASALQSIKNEIRDEANEQIQNRITEAGL